MNRILLIALLVLIGHAVHAQTFGVTVGGRLEPVTLLSRVDTTLGSVPMLGADVGAEMRFAAITIGVRLALSSLLII